LRADGNRRVYRALGRGYWQMLAPETRLLENDSAALGMLVLKLSRLACRLFYAEIQDDWAKLGLDRPRLRVVVTFRSADGNPGAGKTVLDLQVGSPAADILRGLRPELGKEPAVFARLAGEAAVFLLDGELVKGLTRDFR